MKWSILDEQNDFDIPDVTSQALMILRMYSRTLEKNTSYSIFRIENELKIKSQVSIDLT